MKYLEEIIAYKIASLKEKKSSFPLAVLIKSSESRRHFRDFKAAVSPKNRLALIAEVKKASPSAGVIRADFDPLEIAKIYERERADALSVLTEDKFFLGSFANLKNISQTINLPALCKDFIIDEYQIVEAAANGADAVLLIAAILPAKDIIIMQKTAQENGMASLVEIHNDDDLKKALDSGALMIGINNRDLNTFEVDIQTSLSLAAKIPRDRVIISESGIKTREDIEVLKKSGINAVLIGETLMRSKDIASKINELMG